MGIVGIDLSKLIPWYLNVLKTNSKESKDLIKLLIAMAF
jgi:hypothetical protein